MTLPAVESDDVRRISGPKYTVGPRCSNPTCDQFADDAHHIVRRGKVVDDWIAIDGYVTGNLTGLCRPCHLDITGPGGGHKAWIRWIDDTFWWCLVGPPDELGKPTPLPVGPLSYQPPTPDSLASRASDTESGPDTCPFCGQVARRRSSPAQRVGRRRRKRWGVLVPEDELEQGADVLDSLVISLAPLVPNADASATGRYYVIVPALAFALMSSGEFVASFEGRNAA